MTRSRVFFKTFVIFSLFVLWQARADLPVDGEPGVSVRAGARAGQVEVLRNGAVVRALDVPLNWDMSGSWEGAWLRALGGKKVWVLRQKPTDKANHVWIFGGLGDASTIPLIWRGREDGLGEASAVVVGTNEDGFTTLSRVAPPALLPVGCERFASHWTTTTYDFQKEIFVFAAPIAAPAGSALGVKGLASAPVWADFVTRPAHDQAALWVAETLRSDPAKALRDGNVETVLSSPGAERPLLLIRPSKVSAPVRLLLARPAKGDTKGISLQWDAGGVAQATWPPGSAVVEVALPEAATKSQCLALSWEGGAPSEVALLTALDTKPLAEAVGGLVEAALGGATEGASVLSHHGEAVVAHLQTTLGVESSPELLQKALELAGKLPPESGLLVVAALATHPKASQDTVSEALARLRKYPKAASIALHKRLQSLPKTDPQYATAAVQLAQLPTPGALNPLLGLIDQEADASRQALLVSALVAVGPSITDPLLSFVPAPKMKDATRVALLRALLRVSPEALQANKGKSPAKAADLLPLLAHESPQVRLLTVRILGALAVSEATKGLLERFQAADASEVERSEALRALGVVSAVPIEVSLLNAALEDPSPSVRITAAQILASEAYRAGSKPALQKILDREAWPEARSAALLGLCALADPIALARAASWLDDPASDPTLRAASAQALLARPEQIMADLDRAAVWLEDLSLERAVRVDILRAIAQQPDAAPWIEARVKREMALHQEDPEQGGILVIPTLLALRESGADLDTVSTTMLKALNASRSPSLTLAIIDILGLVDHPNIRARLAHERDKKHPILSPAATRSLNKLDGILPAEDPDDLIDF